MQKLIRTFNALYFSAILLSTAFSQGMDPTSYFVKTTKDRSLYELRRTGKENSLLINLPKETLIEIFSHCFVKNKDRIKSLKKSIKNFMRISTVCKKFNEMLMFETIGDLCKNYKQKHKDQTLINLVKKAWELVSISPYVWPSSFRENTYLPQLILVCAGSNISDKNLLEAIMNFFDRFSPIIKRYENPKVQSIDFYCPMYELIYRQRKLLKLQAEEYNNTTCPLTILPEKTLNNIFSYCLIKDVDQVKSLKNSIKCLMKMNTICKKFNDVLTFETIGSLCKNYTQDEKDNALTDLMGRKINWPRNQIKCLPALILVCAGAKEKFRSLLTEAVCANDIQLATTLFKHDVNPNMVTPLFFEIESTEMAQLFIDNKVNIHAVDDKNRNVLWYLMQYNQPAELIQFYLELNVNAKTLSSDNNDCLLHELAQSNYNKEFNIDNFLKNATILLKAIPEMINTINKYGKTPIDTARYCLKHAATPEALEQLIALFRKYGAKTGKEIQQAL